MIAVAFRRSEHLAPRSVTSWTPSGSPPSAVGGCPPSSPRFGSCSAHGSSRARRALLPDQPPAPHRPRKPSTATVLSKPSGSRRTSARTSSFDHPVRLGHVEKMDVTTARLPSGSLTRDQAARRRPTPQFVRRDLAVRSRAVQEYRRARSGLPGAAPGRPEPHVLRRRVVGYQSMMTRSPCSCAQPRARRRRPAWPKIGSRVAVSATRTRRPFCGECRTASDHMASTPSRPRSGAGT